MRVLLNAIIYSITTITFLPRVKAVFPLLSEKGGMSAGDSLWARSSQLHCMDLVLKAIQPQQLLLRYASFFSDVQKSLFRYSVNRISIQIFRNIQQFFQ